MQASRPAKTNELLGQGQARYKTPHVTITLAWKNCLAPATPTSSTLISVSLAS